MFARLLAFGRNIALLGLISGLTLHAQEDRVHIGAMLTVAFPTGEFSGNDGTRDSYYDYGYGRNRLPGFSSAIGGNIFVGLPVTDNITLRPGGSYFRFRGDKGDHWGYLSTPMTLEISSVSCDLQLFFSGPHRRSRGYVFLGMALDSEKLSIGGRAYSSSAPDQYSVKRNAMNIGFGRTWYPMNTPLFYEVGYHRTLSGDMPPGLQMPGSDYWKMSLGCLF